MNGGIRTNGSSRVNRGSRARTARQRGQLGFSEVPTTTIGDVLKRVLSIWRRICALDALTQDLILYLLATTFAGVSAFTGGLIDYREWGQISALAYAVAAAVTAFAIRRARAKALSAHAVSLLRRVTVGALVVSVVVIPLLSELAWRADASPQSHAQPEVAVIERAADRAASGHDPYLASPSSVGIPPSSDAKNVDEGSYFPYLPGMVIFGLINSTSAPKTLGDARVLFVLFSLAVFAVGLRLSRAPAALKGRAVQFFVVLPTGALPFVTGGDDLPVLALLFLALVLASRRQPVAAGLAAAAACTLKFTAFPIVALLFLAVRDRSGRPATLRYGVALATAVPVIFIGWLAGPRAFVENVVQFPLGLTAIKSPAASPLLGQVLVNIFPAHRREVTLLLSIVGLGIVVELLRRHPPRTPAAVAQFSGIALCVATALAPATRFGYLIYPVNLFVWAALLGHVDVATSMVAVADVTIVDVVAGDQLPSGTSRTRRSMLDDTDDVASPPSAGVSDGLSARMITPTSQ
jgi:hypothetical protein